MRERWQPSSGPRTGGLLSRVDWLLILPGKRVMEIAQRGSSILSVELSVLFRSLQTDMFVDAGPLSKAVEGTS